MVRGLLVLMLWPLLRLVGVHLNWRELLALVFSGLRGALSLVLALVTQLESTTLDRQSVDLIVFHTAGIVLLTLCINGSTARFLVQGLRLHQGSVAACSVLAQALRHVTQRVQQRSNTMYADGKFQMADWGAITQSVTNRNEVMAKKVLASKLPHTDSGQQTPAEEPGMQEHALAGSTPLAEGKDAAPTD